MSKIQIRKRLLAAACLLPIFVVMAGCAQDQKAGKSKDQAPTLTIKSPEDGAEIKGNSVLVETKVSRFKLVKPGGKNKTGEGHIHFTLTPVAKKSEIPGSPKLVHLGEEKEEHSEEEIRKSKKPVLIMSSTNQGQFSEVVDGSYRVTAELVQNNHTKLSPPVKKTISFTAVQTTSPSPGAGSSDYGR